MRNKLFVNFFLPIPPDDSETDPIVSIESGWYSLALSSRAIATMIPTPWGDLPRGLARYAAENLLSVSTSYLW